MVKQDRSGSRVWQFLAVSAKSTDICHDTGNCNAQYCHTVEPDTHRSHELSHPKLSGA